MENKPSQQSIDINEHSMITSPVKKKKKSKKKIQWREEVEVHIVDNWKEFNMLDNEFQETRKCKCDLI